MAGKYWIVVWRKQGGGDGDGAGTGAEAGAGNRRRGIPQCAVAVACLTSFAADTCLMFYCCLTGNAVRCNCNCIRLKLINLPHTQREREREQPQAHWQDKSFGKCLPNELQLLRLLFLIKTQGRWQRLALPQWLLVSQFVPARHWEKSCNN